MEPAGLPFTIQYTFFVKLFFKLFLPSLERANGFFQKKSIKIIGVGGNRNSRKS